MTQSTPLILKAFKNELEDRPPVWMMRQAGRYLPEYRALKEQYSFLTLCKTPELAAEVTLQPIKRLRPDAAIIFADILLPVEPLGFELDFNPGPQIKGKIDSVSAVQRLKKSASAKNLHYVGDALRLVKAELEKMTSEGERPGLIGFAGAPWTMACYLIEQGKYKHFAGTQIFAARHPQAFSELLERLVEITIEYLLMQIEAGAEVIQLFDSWAGNLSLDDYRRYALPAIVKIFEALPSNIPTILYASGTKQLAPALIESGAKGISCDWKAPIAELSKIVPKEILLQGNFDPTHLYRPAGEIEEEAKSMIAQGLEHGRYVANLGHGILLDTPVENAQAFLESVKTYSSNNA